jgi:folate-dependent phosphoribosylglycinamide formyltransferase PurN
MKLRAALLVDNLQVARWQLEALEAANDSIDIVLLLNCENTRNKKNYVKNLFYYALNVFTLKNSLTKRAPINREIAKVINFESIYEGAWQSFPKKIYESLEKENIDLVIKFGMSLLRLEENRKIPPILSFHHGNPSKYRGRPAGFYEIINREKSTGIIVQSLSNKLDAGEIYAYAESKIVNYSYKKTALNFYSNSVPLLNKAIVNLAKQTPTTMSVDGKNYRLPSNDKVVSFILLLCLNAIKKVIYGLFFEKRWNIATCKTNLSLNASEELLSQTFKEVPIQEKYNFYADPFYSEDGSKVRLEALDNRTGLGDILEIDSNNYANQRVLLSGEHFSYPCTFTHDGEEYLLPEVASHSAQYIIATNKIGEKYYLKGLEGKRIVDATLHQEGGKAYLFFGENTTAHTVLNLWIADSPFSEFKPHPMNPVVISPSVARMGGKIINHKGKTLRFGQNNSGEYGESISVMQITALSDKEYREVEVGKITIDKFNGPHSIGFNFDMSEILIDYYSNKFSLFAGVRRIKARLKKR